MNWDLMFLRMELKMAVLCVRWPSVRSPNSQRPPSANIFNSNLRRNSLLSESDRSEFSFQIGNDVFDEVLSVVSGAAARDLTGPGCAHPQVQCPHPRTPKFNVGARVEV